MPAKKNPKLTTLKDWTTYYKTHSRGEAVPDEAAIALVNKKSLTLALAAYKAIADAGNAKRKTEEFRKAAQTFKRSAQALYKLRESIPSTVLTLRTSYVDEQGGVASVGAIIEPSALDQFMHEDLVNDGMFAPLADAIQRAYGLNWDGTDSQDEYTLLEEVLDYKTGFKVRPGSWTQLVAIHVVKVLYLESVIERAPRLN